MDYKERYKEIISKIKSTVRNKDGRAIRNEDIAGRLNYERSYFSTLLGTRGEVTEKHIRALEREFAKELETQNLGNSNFDNKVKGELTLKDLADELKDSKEQLQQLLVSLDTLLRRQQVIAAMNHASLEALLYDLADRKKLNRSAVKNSVRNRAFSKLDQFSLKGIEIDSYT